MQDNTPKQPEASPTQLLRNLIEDTTCGMATADEMHDALTLLEQVLHLAPTQPQFVLEAEVTA